LRGKRPGVRIAARPDLGAVMPAGNRAEPSLPCALAMAKKREAASLHKRRIDRMFEAWSQESGRDDLEPGDLFALFALEMRLGSDDLYETALEDSLIGGSGDGGVDAMLTLCNNEAIDDALPAKDIPSQSEIVLHLLQATVSPQMTVSRLQRARTSLTDILDLDEELPLGDSGADYNERFIEQARSFRETVRNGKGKRLKIEVVFHLANTGDISNAKDDFNRERRRIEGLDTAGLVHWIAVEVHGARELIKLHVLKDRIAHLELKCEKVLPLGPGTGDQQSRIALTKLSEYDNFVTETSKDDNDKDERRIRHALFAGNIRHFRGTSGVNAKIRESLEIASQGHLSADFWSLNNGITILASSIEQQTKTELTIHDPLVVNGLQTSFVVSTFFGGETGQASDESIVVKVVVAKDSAARAAIIRATNQQTPVQAWSLFAADERQIALAEHFEQQGWFYERLAGQGRWENKPRAKTIDMRFLAQAVLAIGLNSPETARARPGSVFNEEGYAGVFNDRTTDEMYFWLGRTLKSVDDFLMPRHGVAEKGERATLRFHVARQLVARELRTPVRKPTQLHKLVDEDREFTKDEMTLALSDVRRAVKQTGETAERASKGSDLRVKLDGIVTRLKNRSKVVKPPAKKRTPVRKRTTAKKRTASRPRRKAG
jgi:hypothetical protein